MPSLFDLSKADNLEFFQKHFDYVTAPESKRAEKFFEFLIFVYQKLGRKALEGFVASETTAPPLTQRLMVVSIISVATA